MSFMITMSQKELHRLEVIQKIRDERLSVVQAAELLGLSRSQVHQEGAFPTLQNVRHGPAGDACGDHREQAAEWCAGLYRGTPGSATNAESEDQQREDRLQAAGQQAGWANGFHERPGGDCPAATRALRPRCDGMTGCNNRQSQSRFERLTLPLPSLATRPGRGLASVQVEMSSVAFLTG